MRIGNDFNCIGGRCYIFDYLWFSEYVLALSSYIVIEKVCECE